MRGSAEVEASGEGVGGDVGAGVGVTDLDESGGTSKGFVLTKDDGNIAWQEGDERRGWTVGERDQGGREGRRGMSKT